MAGDFFLRAQKEVTKKKGTLGAALFRAAAPDSPSLAHGRSSGRPRPDDLETGHLLGNVIKGVTPLVRLPVVFGLVAVSSVFHPLHVMLRRGRAVGSSVQGCTDERARGGTPHERDPSAPCRDEGSRRP
jgi:hypothetical protein